MENKKTIRAILFLALTFALALIVGIMESVPDHRVGYQDYSWWTTLEVYPCLFFVHGILSGFVLTNSMKILKFVSTPLMTSAAFIVNRLATDGLSFFDGIARGLLGGMVYTIPSLFGLILCLIVRKMFGFLRNNGK
jgi:hypothetical protein